MTPDASLTLAGLAIAVAIPATFLFARWISRHVDHGEARFGPDGKMIEDEDRK
ncbi:MAG: glutamyl-tRNA amidotransferase [Erythrobacter sp.]